MNPQLTAVAMAKQHSAKKLSGQFKSSFTKTFPRRLEQNFKIKITLYSYFKCLVIPGYCILLEESLYQVNKSVDTELPFGLSFLGQQLKKDGELLERVQRRL